MKHIVIIGNGIAGVTAARHLRKNSEDRITIISKESAYFFSRTALMYVYMGHMKFEHTQPYEPHFWKKNRIDLLQDTVLQVHPDTNEISLQQSGVMRYDILILATGSIPNKFGWPGEDLKGVQGLVSKQDLELLEQNAPNNKVCKRAVIIGGGLIGVEFAEMMLSRGIEVTFLVREKGFWSGVLPEPNATMIAKHIREHHVDLREQEELEEILADSDGRVRGIRTKSDDHIDCQVVGLCAGVRPQIAFLSNSGIETDRGILVNEYLQTNIDNIYAIGDCAQQRTPIGQRKAIEAVWYTGRMMGEAVAQTITGSPTKWNPGHWFNSAKFFDIEYQTYGWVWNSPKPGNQHFHWQHSDGMRAVTIEYQTDNDLFVGVNTFGIRMKHEVFDYWLTKGASVHDVVGALDTACFNPEFFAKPYQEIKNSFQQHQLVPS